MKTSDQQTQEKSGETEERQSNNCLLCGEIAVQVRFQAEGEPFETMVNRYLKNME